MIVEAKIISQPDSGEYQEKIYDVPNPWNSQGWTWVKFVADDSNEWCGNFRGSPKGVAMSEKQNAILVLTSDHLYKLERSNGNLLAYEAQTDYQTITASPSGVFIAADFYQVEIIDPDLKSMKPIASPVELDTITFKGWQGNKLVIEAEELMNDGRQLELELDGDTYKMTIKSSRQV